MIECLSQPGWINPQIDFLLFLQNLRIGHFEMFDKFFLSVTIFGEYWLPTLICAIVYWCIDFKAGMYLFSLEGINVLISHLLKMIACVYRPWVLSDKIHPSELAVPFAKGYSCPSGHSAMSSSVLGGVAYLQRKRISVCLLFICLILLVGFSRMWLGVHTPQDVLSGFGIGLILIFSVNRIINWAEKNVNRYLYLAGIIDIFAVLAIIYISCFNTYRMDYVDGQLLVDPKKSIYLTIVVFAYVLSLINGCFLCRRFFPFEPKQSSVKARIVRGLIGSIITVLMLKYIVNHVILVGVDLSIAVSSMVFAGLLVTLIYPIIFVKAEKFLAGKTAE